jgi:4-amino-4-deoxychorismate lyase
VRGASMNPGGDAPDGVLFNGLDLCEGAAEAARGAVMSLLTDRGLHYGDGLFETIACHNGEPRFLWEHLERLALGCERLSIELGSRGALVDDVLRLAAGMTRALVKVLVTRGPAGRGYAPRGAARPSRIVLRYGWPAEDPRSAEQGVAVQIADFTLAENPRLAGLKHLNRLEQVLARAELAGSGLDEALLLSRSGCLVSGTMSNVFVVSGSRVATPRLDRCGVAGVMRRVLMRAAAASGVVVEEARLTRQDLEAADEVFLTNVRIGIWPVRVLGSRELGAGPLTRRLQRLIEPLLATSGVQRAGGAR